MKPTEHEKTEKTEKGDKGVVGGGVPLPGGAPKLASERLHDEQQAQFKTQQAQQAEDQKSQMPAPAGTIPPPGGFFGATDDARAAKQRADARATQNAASPAPKAEQQVGLDANGTGSYVYCPTPAGDARARSLTLDGVRYEHVGEDAQGRWLYRHLSRK